jgi:hypothetical protein
VPQVLLGDPQGVNGICKGLRENSARDVEPWRQRAATREGNRNALGETAVPVDADELSIAAKVCGTLATEITAAAQNQGVDGDDLTGVDAAANQLVPHHERGHTHGVRSTDSL